MKEMCALLLIFIFFGMTHSSVFQTESTANTGSSIHKFYDTFEIGSSTPYAAAGSSTSYDTESSTSFEVESSTPYVAGSSTSYGPGGSSSFEIGSSTFILDGLPSTSFPPSSMLFKIGTSSTVFPQSSTPFETTPSTVLFQSPTSLETKNPSSSTQFETHPSTSFPQGTTINETGIFRMSSTIGSTSHETSTNSYCCPYKNVRGKFCYFE